MIDFPENFNNRNYDYQIGIIETTSSKHSFNTAMENSTFSFPSNELFVDGRNHIFNLDSLKKITLIQMTDGKEKKIIAWEGDNHEIN